MRQNETKSDTIFC